MTAEAVGFSPVAPVSHDAEYLRRLHMGFDPATRAEFDKWLNLTLNDIFRPLCEVTAESALYMTTKDVAQALGTIRRPEIKKIDRDPRNDSPLPLSHQAPEMMHFELEFAGRGSKLFPSPLASDFGVWTRDTTVTEDILNAANILCLQIPSPLAEETGKQNATLIDHDTVRGHRNHPPQAVKLIMAEGVISLVQSLTLGLGQFHDQEGSEEELVERLITGGVPLQFARSMPNGELENTSSSFQHMPGLLVEHDGKFKIDPEHKRTAIQVKQERSERIRRGVRFTSEELYMRHKEFNETLSNSPEGQVCPVSRRNPTSGSNPDSGIEMLSGAFLHIFKELRVIRAQAVAS